MFVKRYSIQYHCNDVLNSSYRLCFGSIDALNNDFVNP